MEVAPRPRRRTGRSSWSSPDDGRGRGGTRPKQERRFCVDDVFRGLSPTAPPPFAQSLCVPGSQTFEKKRTSSTRPGNPTLPIGPQLVGARDSSHRGRRRTSRRCENFLIGHDFPPRSHRGLLSGERQSCPSSLLRGVPATKRAASCPLRQGNRDVPGAALCQL